MTRKASPVRHRRLLLAVTSALSGFVTAPVIAQSVPAIPTSADAVRVRTNLLGLDPQITNPNGDLNVRLRASNTVIDWNGFNIPENRTANFDNGTLLGGNIAVLNRDVSGNVSQLLGKLTSDPSVAVWVYNPNGIIVGSKAAFSTGSLVLSTLDVDSNDFIDGGRNYRLSTAAGSTAGITVLNGAQIKVEGGTRGLVMVAPRIDADGTFQAVGQDVAFVTATDVTLTYNPNSPLSVTLNRGTAVPGRSQYVRGSVAGADALFALASQGTVTDALLQVDASVTTALVGTRGIVLSAGRPANAIDGVAFSGAPADTGGTAALVVNGALTTTDQDGSDILAGASGGASFAGALSSQRDILIAAAGPLSVAGAVTAGRDYRLAGRGIALGGAVPVTQRAAREVRIESTDGDITGAAGLALRSGGSGALVLATDGATAGNILFDATSRLTGGGDRQGYVDLRLRSADNRVALGDVTARGLRQSIGAGGVRNGLTTTGALSIGNVDVRDALTLEGAGVTTGTLASDRGVSVLSNGALATGAITARDGSVSLTGSGSTSIAGDIVASAGASDIVVTRDGSLSLQGLTAARDVRIDGGAGAVSVAGGVIAGRNYLVSGGGVTLGGTVPVTQRAEDVVTITAGAGGITGLQGLTLRSDRDGSGGDALTLAVTAPSTTGIAFATGTSVFGGSARQSDVQIRLNDAASPIAFDRIEARNLTGLTTTGALRLGDVAIVGDLTARGASIETGALTSGSGGVTLVAGAGVLTTGAVNAARAVSLTGSDRVTTGRIAAGEGVTVDGQGIVTLGGDLLAGGAVAVRGASLAFAGNTLRSGGSVDLLARSGGIASSGALAIISTSTRASDFVRLQATGAAGIVLAPGSTITAGADRALRVGVFNGTADAPLSLGNVTARSLSALATAGGDATRPGNAIVSGGSLSFGALDLIDGFAAESTGGDLTVGRIAVSGQGQGISLRAANGALNVQNDIAASGDVTLASGTALRLNTVESRDGRAALTSGGAITLARLTGGLGATAMGSQVTIDAVRGGAVGLSASAGDVQVGRIDGAAVSASATGGAVNVRDVLLATGAVNLTATGEVRVAGALTGTGVTVQADGDAALLGGVQAIGNVALTGRSVTLGGAQSAAGRYAVTSTAGDIVGRAGTSIVADSDGQGAEALVLNARGGGIAFDPASSLRGGNGTSAVALTTDGGTIGIGDVRATMLTATGAASIRTGNLSLVDALSLRAGAGIATGTIATQNGGVTLAAGTGPLTTGAITAGGGVALTGGSIVFGRVQGSALTATAASGTLTGGDIVVGDAVSLQASDALGVGAITAGGSVGLSGRGIRFGRLDAASLTATSGGAIGGGDIISRGDATLTATDAIGVGGVRAAGGVALRGASIGAGGVEAAGLTASATAGGLSAGDLVIGGAATLAATGGLTLGGVTAGGMVSLTGTDVGFGRIDAGSFAATATSGAARGGDILTRGGTTITAAGAIGVNNLTSGGAVTLRGASIVAGRIEGAALAATADSGAFAAGDVLTGDGVTIEAARGTIDVGTVTTTRGDVALSSGGRLSAAGVAAGGTATLRTLGSGADILLANGLTATGSVMLAGTGNIRAPSIVSRTGDLTIAAPNGELTGFAPGSGVTLGAGPGRAFSLTIGSAARLGDVVGGQLTVVATAISAGRIDTGTQGLDLRATNGDLTLTGPVRGGIVNLGASGRTSLTQVTASGALTLDGGTGISFGDIAGASIDARSGGTITGVSARSAGALGLRGAALTLDQATAGAGATLAATAGDLRLTGVTSGGDAVLSATGLARIAGGVASGGAYRVSGGSVALGSDGIAQRAAGEVRITATTGDIAGARGLTLTSDADGAGGERLVLDAAGGIGFAGTRLLGGSGGGALGLRAGSGRAIQLGSVQAARIGGFDGSNVLNALTHDAGIVADDVAVGTLNLVATRGDMTIGRIAATGDVALRTDGGAMALGEVRGAAIDLTSSGALTTGAVTSTGATALRGERIDVAGRLAAARQLLAEARAALTLRDASAGGAMTLAAGGALTTGALDAAAITARGAGVTLASARAGDALALTSSRDLSIGTSSAGGTATLDVAGLATIAGLTAGPVAQITANDVALTGPLRAQSVSFANRAAATTTMRIGDGTGTDGFRLSDAEVRQVTTDTLRFDAGSGAMEIGTLALATGSGRAVEMLGTGDIRVIGAVSTQGSGRSVRIGGGRDGGNANAIHVVATHDGGGRLLFDGSDVELRGSRIAIGLAPGFIDTLQPGAAGLAQAQTLIGNGNSALYNPQLGGGFYDPNATTTLSARTLTVRFGDYALFQNTAIPGSFSGVQIGGTPAAPITPALRISSFGNPAQASVAVFGTINGTGGASAALLGNPVINIDPLLLPNSRINGCLAGSGAGCITTIVIQPTLQVFDWSSEEVFGIARDVAVPFTPVIGGNNEELLSDLPALAPETPADRKGQF